MKDYFTRMFGYDLFANKILAETISKVNNPEKPVKLMAHLLAAHQIWLNRCKGLPAPGGALWPDWPADSLNDIIDQNGEAWRDYVKGLQAEDFDKVISYKNSKGEPFESKLTDVLAHVINHGTHHRAQAGQHLITAGIEKLPPTDYIFFIRAQDGRL